MEDVFSAKKIGLRIKYELLERNMKQKELSELTGLNQNTISNYLSGNRIPDTLSVYKISKALNVSMEYILTGNETTTYFPVNEEEIRILKLFKMLPKEDKIKVEGMLEYKVIENENLGRR